MLQVFFPDVERAEWLNKVNCISFYKFSLQFVIKIACNKITFQSDYVRLTVKGTASQFLHHTHLAQIFQYYSIRGNLLHHKSWLIFHTCCLELSLNGSFLILPEIRIFYFRFPPVQCQATVRVYCKIVITQITHKSSRQSQSSGLKLK